MSRSFCSRFQNFLDYFQRDKICNFIGRFVAQGEPFRADNRFRHLLDARFIAVIADDQIFDDAAFQLLARNVFADIRRDRVFNWRGVVFDADVQSVG